MQLNKQQINILSNVLTINYQYNKKSKLWESMRELNWYLDTNKTFTNSEIYTAKRAIEFVLELNTGIASNGDFKELLEILKMCNNNYIHDLHI